MKNLASSTKVQRKNLGIEMKQIKANLFRERMLYAVSPHLFPKPPDLPEHTHFIGYHERDKLMHWEPSAALKEFIQKHKKIFFITFGSMRNPKPEANSRLLLGILELLKIPTIVNVYGGGLQKVEVDENLFHFVDRVPYEWLFPKVHAVIHHGGSGTTHMAAKYGCVQMIIPHIIDQYLWNEVVAKQELGPKGKSIRKINKTWFQKQAEAIWESEKYKKNAQDIGTVMQNEDLAEVYLDLVGA